MARPWELLLGNPARAQAELGDGKMQRKRCRGGQGGEGVLGAQSKRSRAEAAPRSHGVAGTRAQRGGRGWREPCRQLVPEEARSLRRGKGAGRWGVNLNQVAVETLLAEKGGRST